MPPPRANGVTSRPTPPHQQKGWKSVNLAQPFSSKAEGLGVLAAHTLEPTSTATPGAGTGEFTGSSNTVHEVPAGGRHSSTGTLTRRSAPPAFRALKPRTAGAPKEVTSGHRTPSVTMWLGNLNWGHGAAGVWA